MNRLIRHLPSLLLGALGRRTIGLVLYVLDLVAFVLDLLGRGRTYLNGATYQAVVSQLIFSGVDAMPAVTLLATVIGAAVTSQLMRLMQMVGDEATAISTVIRIVALELSPLITAILLIGRTGSAITVDLGNMKLHREVEGLALLGIDVRDLFIAPRLVGVTVAQLVLAIYFAVIAIGSGVLFSALTLSLSQLKYLLAFPLAFDPFDLVSFTIKNVLFGTITGAVACYHGLQVASSPTEVPQQTQRSIVNAMVMVFAIDGLIAVALS